MADEFSNGGVDTFQQIKHYISLRIRQGVPLLDRDLNELQDIRLHYERAIRKYYLGEGAPDGDGFRIAAPPVPAPNDFVIKKGRVIVDGWDLENESDIFYSQQTGLPTLPAAGANDQLLIYAVPQLVRIDSSLDPALSNSQDINLETAQRDKLAWSVRFAKPPQSVPAGALLLAVIKRPAGATNITAPMIEDKRRSNLKLATVKDDLAAIDKRLVAAEQKIIAMQTQIAALETKVAKLFWDLTLSSTQTAGYFGSSLTISIVVKDGLGQPVQNAALSFSTDYGLLDPSHAVTNAAGKASFQLVALEVPIPPTRSEMVVLDAMAQKVGSAQVGNSGVVRYENVRFQPHEVSLMSRYAPVFELQNLSADKVSAPVTAVPRTKWATVTVHAKESGGAVVRGVGSIQVSFGYWLRDWVRTKVYEATAGIDVGVRVGDFMRRSVSPEGFNVNGADTAMKRMLGELFEEVDDRHAQSVFDAAVGADDPDGGLISRVIREEANNDIGSRTAKAVEQQLQSFVQAGQVTAQDARTHQLYLKGGVGSHTTGYTALAGTRKGGF